jgi:hypothetical protein
MGLFKSKGERKMERDIKIRSGLQKLKRQIKSLEKNETSYLTKARRAVELGDNANLRMIKSVLKKTMGQRRVLERQMLTLETAIQLKDQAESHMHFAESMQQISIAIGQAFEGIDMGASIGQFEKAMTQAETLEQRMEIFLDMSEDSVQSAADGVDLGVSDAEIDTLLSIEASAPDATDQLDAEISDELRQIEKELGS